MYAAELPDPISNSEVKRGRADDSLAHASAKVGSCPFMLKPSLSDGFFVFNYNLYHWNENPPNGIIKPICHNKL